MSIIDNFEDLPRFDDISHPAGRTLLYSLTPIGLGTPLQESLLSFLVRVSRAHAVNPRRLVGDVLAQGDSTIRQLAYASFYRTFAKTVNGIGQYAELFAAVLERATGTKHLRQLTLLPWRDLFPFNGQGTLAPHPQWCPTCLIEQCPKIGERYFPLAWSLVACKMCPMHECKFETLCPHCGKHQSFIPRYPDAGICSECGNFLVSEKVLSAKHHVPPSGHERWAADALLTMIARQSSPTTLPTADDFRAFVATVVEREAGGNRAALCKKIGLRSWALNGWLNKGDKPSMAQLLDMCYRMGVSPANIGPRQETITETVAMSSCEKLIRRRGCGRLTYAQREELRAQLEIFLSGEISPPVSHIASKLGVTARCLRYWFPGQCVVLTERARVALAEKSINHQAKQKRRVKTIVQQLRQAGRNPSRRQVSDAIGKEGMSLAQPHLLMAFREAITS